MTGKAKARQTPEEEATNDATGWALKGRHAKYETRVYANHANQAQSRASVQKTVTRDSDGQT